MVRVFLVDDHEVARRGVRHLLEREEDLEVVGEADDLAAARARLPALRPEVVVVDVRLPDGNGIDLCAEVRDLDRPPATVVLTGFEHEADVLDAVLAGASAFLGKTVRGHRIVEAVREAAAGRSVLDERAATIVMDRLRNDAANPDPMASLTERERSVLALVGEGLTNREIGTRLHLTEKTIKNYVSDLLAKLGTPSRVRLAILAADRRMRTGSAA
ncbi:response regulator [Actinomycetospora chiangmaiensis]|uniref:response regulator n=1 Tax=Actinomycetospora chiangmaiensis TaxID=402650 RepID=UPI00037BC96D|nr:response regulator transcription factor [Actinomycetospora chiangmaiensis]